ncbi:ribonuclease H-like domain-containing protein [Annulohypoxylon maeteangense]|uniref:ribonuclease H-like domain-containing protein n=1 Tax=Annulohypoxylon maeteangense TaxID=1927788 RepID=UPI002008300B|nr:ribonuclease H-like domain-containing protein [Annulohypoxylon maeteangense]KAI0886987.1 ribonuclease H-like domain-containing protein [Annulohypoxylon maeteangense]
MGSSQDFKSVQEKIQSALVATTRLTNQIAAEDVNFQRTSNPEVEEQLDDASGRLLALASSLLKSSTKSTDIKAPNIEDSDEIDVQWSRIVDVVDTLLEKADTCLDEYTGVIKRKAAPTDQPGPSSKKSRSTTLENSMRRADITKPQLLFEVKPNNFSTEPWKPILTTKPHALVSFEESLETFKDENQTTQYKHPYEAEILELEYPETVFQAKEPIKYQPVEMTAATFVDTFEGVLEMLVELKTATEIAIDTEHHDFRTYTGLLSLMQISTREKDWIVDTLQPWRRKLEVLNEVFADPKIVKVLHGAYMDILWLQRDCGIYIVGLFDTFEAAVALQYPSRGLAYLLKKFVDFDADKRYQLADWRIRPIPEEMFYYARSDTHYLLYIYDMMRNELLEQCSQDPEHGLVRQVLDKSKDTSLRRHETFPYDAEGGQGPSGWFNQLIRYSAGKYSKEQFAVFRALHKWRDEIARREDESTVYIMNMSTLFNIARRMPPDAKALHSLLEPSSPPITKREAFNLSKIINKARVAGANGPSVLDVIRSNNASSTIGIGEVAKSVFPQLRSENAEVLGTQDLVSQTSRLWGKIPMSSRWEEPSAAKTSRIVQFELPWAKFVKSSKLTEEVVVRPQRPVTKEEDVISLEQPAEVPPPVDQEFTLKTGLKRKAIHVASESDSDEVDDTPSKLESTADDSLGAEEIAVPDTDDSEDQRREDKKSKKAAEKARKWAVKEERRAKKLAKRAKKDAEASGVEASRNGGNEDEVDAPFDYSKAKTVLNASRTTNSTPQAPKFNPYGMTSEGPKPARKMHGEKAGKSHTFRK